MLQKIKIFENFCASSVHTDNYKAEARQTRRRRSRLRQFEQEETVRVEAVRRQGEKDQFFTILWGSCFMDWS